MKKEMQSKKKHMNILNNLYLQHRQEVIGNPEGTVVCFVVRNA